MKLSKVIKFICIIFEILQIFFNDRYWSKYWYYLLININISKKKYNKLFKLFLLYLKY